MALLLVGNLIVDRLQIVVHTQCNILNLTSTITTEELRNWLGIGSHHQPDQLVDCRGSNPHLVPIGLMHALVLLVGHVLLQLVLLLWLTQPPVLLQLVALLQTEVVIGFYEGLIPLQNSLAGISPRKPVVKYRVWHLPPLVAQRLLFAEHAYVLGGSLR